MSKKPKHHLTLHRLFKDSVKPKTPEEWQEVFDALNTPFLYAYGPTIDEYAYYGVDNVHRHRIHSLRKPTDKGNPNGNPNGNPKD